MRHSLTALLILTAAASAATRICDVEPYRNCNGWTSAEPNMNWVAQSFVCTADSLLWAEFFVGAANAAGQYYFAIRPNINGTILYDGHADAGDLVHYEYARANLTNEAHVPLIKGGTYVLQITHTAGESINYYYDPNNPYKYGSMTVGGGKAPPPGEIEMYDLACRIEGIVYNNPDMVSTWDQIPAHLGMRAKDTAWRHLWLHRITTREDESLGLVRGAAVMYQLGVRAARICGGLPPPPDTLEWWKTGQDCAWRILTLDSIRPHLVIQGGGAWPLDGSDPDHLWPAGMYEPIIYSSGGIRQVNRSNHLAWFAYNYALRYGPRGFSKNGEPTGSFWDEYSVPYLPLQYVECNNEPAVNAIADWWQHDPLNDTVVDSVRGPVGREARQRTFTKVYCRYCEVVNTAMKFASDSIRCQIYCPYGFPGELDQDEWLGIVEQCGGSSICEMVDFHSHYYPAEAEDYRTDSVYHLLKRHHMDNMQVAIGEGGMPWNDDLMPVSIDSTAKTLTKTYVTFWARNASPEKPIVYFDHEATSAWFVPDRIRVDEGNGLWHYEDWGMTDTFHFGYRAPAHTMKQVTHQLSGKAFCREWREVTGLDTVRVFEFQNHLQDNTSKTGSRG